MGTTNRAEELAKEYANIKHDRPIDQEERYFKDYQKYDGFIAGFNSRQSEIDELTKEVKILTSLSIDYVNQINDLKKEVERMRKEREWISVFRSDIQIPIDTPILCRQKAGHENFNVLILGWDEKGEFREFDSSDYSEELYTSGHFPKIEFWQPLPPINH